MFHEKRIQKLCTITNKDGKKKCKTLYKVWGTKKIQSQGRLAKWEFNKLDNFKFNDGSRW
jgi:hypothetical protein